MTVHFQGPLSLFQSDEDSVRRSHPRTAAMQNDFTEILLGFFVPWEQLPTLFLTYDEPKRDASSVAWNHVEPTLSNHLKDFAKNMDLLHKSRDDVKVDAALRASEMAGIDIDDEDPNAFASDSEEEPLHLLSEDLSTANLISAVHSVTTSWQRDAVTAAKRLPSLRIPSIVHALEPRSLGYSPLT